jgi:pimeloyl-ACP methyl ester carboxylesterase
MSTIKSKVGVEIFYEDWGKGQPHRLLAWLAALQRRLGRADDVLPQSRLSRDRARSSWSWPFGAVADGHDMDHYADDLAALTAHLDRRNAVHVGHSTGGGEVVHYLARHGESLAFSQTDFTEDLKKITVPVLVMHGDDDQIVPYADSAPLSAKLLKNGILKTYKGFAHGMPTTEAATINADLLAFIKS